MELDYEKDIEIDPDALDVEALRQASLYYKYSKNEAEAKRNRDLVWEKLKIKRSELILEANGNPKLKNAAAVEAYYRQHPEHIAIKEELAEAEYQVNIANAACFSMNQRKNMIEVLTRLVLSDYFARPAEPRNLSEEVKKTKEEKQHERKVERAGRKRPRRR